QVRVRHRRQAGRFSQVMSARVRATATGSDPIEVLSSPRRRDNWMLREKMVFPKDSVFVKTLSLQDDTGRQVQLETQMLHFEGTEWRGYSYLWNSDQTDAELVGADGTQVVLSDYGQFASGRVWQVHSRAECIRCHNAWVGGPLAFTPPQLNLVLGGNGSGSESGLNAGKVQSLNQLSELKDAGWLTGAIPDDPASSTDAKIAALVNPSDPNSADVDRRARSYLSVNCSHCHQNGAGGTATIDLRHEVTADAMQLLNARPAQGVFGLTDAALVTPGNPARSVLYYRMACSGRGRMPHIGSAVADTHGVRLIGDWIRSLGDATDPGFVQKISAEQIQALLSAEALQDSTAALTLLEQLLSGRLTPDRTEQLLTLARTLPPETRDVFDVFQPDEFQQRRRATFQTASLLIGEGNADAGAQIFGDRRFQCITCHQINQQGGQVGPALDDVGRRLTRPQILESLLNPSARIDPRYTTWSVVTHDGQVHAGLMIERTETLVTLRDVKAQDTVIPRNAIEEMVSQQTSLMPDRLLSELTDQQIRDLLAFLSRQQGQKN
ncbi:MAG: c-type cytochrome, partial [Planctomycetaceae bacterium]|nr:c-type cytochrome [Planctomycetaceae bacterium]